MKLSPKNRQLALVGGFLVTATVAFSVGRMANFLDAPVTPQVAGGGAGGNATPGGPGGHGPGEAGGTRVVSSFGAVDAGFSGAGATVEQITGGQPLDEWLKKLMAQDDELYRMQNFMKIINALNSPEDIKAALKIIGEQRGGGGGRGGPGGFGRPSTEYAMLMEKFTQIDPKAAITYAGEQQGMEKFSGVSTALRTWTRLDPAAALAWAEAEGANIKMDFGRGGPGGGQDSGAEETKQNFALMGVLSQLAKTDLDKAMSVATSSKDIGNTGMLVRALASEMISQRGVDAARKSIDSMADGEFKKDYIRSLTGRMAQQDPAGTASWALSLTGEAKQQALSRTINERAQKDAKGAFLAKQAVTPETDPARATYARQVMRQDPQGAVTWASTILDEKSRAETVTVVVNDWVRRDPEPAKQWVAQSSLPEEQKADLLKAGAGGNRGPGGGGGQRFGAGGGAPGGRGGR